VSGSRPAISVVLVTANRPVLVRDALAGIASQRELPLEVRIADDGDVPLDPDAVAAPLLEVSVRTCSARRAAAARNLAARGANGDVIAFLDDDDVWLPEHLQGLAAAFRDPRIGIAYRDVAVVRETEESGVRREIERRVIARDWDAQRMRTDDFVPPSALAVRRSLFERLGGFDERFRYSEDWDFLLRAARISTPLRVPGVTVEVRMRESGNASAENGAERVACLASLAERHGLPPLEVKTFWEVAEAVASAPPP
jgi:O-antigen biosynthesis protein